MNWKGPKSKYGEKLLDPRWQKLRLQVFQRDEFTCQLCSAKDRTLHLHHAAYCPWSDDPWETPAAVLFTVCADCHESEHEVHRDALFDVITLLGEAGIRTSLDLSHVSMCADIELHHIAEGRTRSQTTQEEKLRALVAALSDFARSKNESVRAGDWRR